MKNVGICRKLHRVPGIGLRWCQLAMGRLGLLIMSVHCLVSVPTSTQPEKRDSSIKYKLDLKMKGKGTDSTCRILFDLKTENLNTIE